MAQCARFGRTTARVRAHCVPSKSRFIGDATRLGSSPSTRAKKDDSDYHSPYDAAMNTCPPIKTGSVDDGPNNNDGWLLDGEHPLTILVAR